MGERGRGGKLSSLIASDILRACIVEVETKVGELLRSKK